MASNLIPKTPTRFRPVRGANGLEYSTVQPKEVPSTKDKNMPSFKKGGKTTKGRRK